MFLLSLPEATIAPFCRYMRMRMCKRTLTSVQFEKTVGGDDEIEHVFCANRRGERTIVDKSRTHGNTRTESDGLCLVAYLVRDLGANSDTRVDFPIRRLPRTVTRDGVAFCQSPSSLFRISVLPTNIFKASYPLFGSMISNFGLEINYTPYFVPEIPFVNSGTKSTGAHFSCPVRH